MGQTVGKALEPADTRPEDARTGGRFNLRNVRTFESLKNAGYRFYFFGMVGQWGAMNMQMVTKSLLLYRLTGSAAMLGIMALATAIPQILLSLFGGAIADRVSKKLVLQIGQLASALVSLSVGLALTTGYLSPDNPGSSWVLIAQSAAQGSIMALMMPSRSAIIPQIVGPGQVMNAMALNSLGMNTLRLLAPAAAGFLIDFTGFAAIFFSMAGLYIMAVVLTSFIKTRPVAAQPSGKHKGTMGDIMEGLKYIWHESTLFIILAFTLVVVILSMPYQMLMPIFVDDILKVGASGMGLLMSISGIGAMTGSLILASIPNKKRGVLLLGSALLLGLALAAFAFSRSMALSMGIMVFVGLGQAGRMTLGTTLLQSYADEKYFGRVMSINMIDMGLSSLGTFVAGLIAENMGADLAIGGFAAILAAASLLSLVFLRRVRKLD
jgi:MFS family permease